MPILSEPGEMAFLLPEVARCRSATMGEALGIRIANSMWKRLLGWMKSHERVFEDYDMYGISISWAGILHRGVDVACNERVLRFGCNGSRMKCFRSQNDRMPLKRSTVPHVTAAKQCITDRNGRRRIRNGSC